MFLRAVRGNDLERVRYLFSQGVMACETEIRYAVTLGNLETVKEIFVQSGKNSNTIKMAKEMLPVAVVHEHSLIAEYFRKIIASG